MRVFLVIVLSLTAGVASSQVVINEVCAANYNSWAHTGPNNTFYAGTQYHDWIELINTSGSAVNLGGYHLSDKLNNPTKFVIPAGTTIPANGRKVFICSGYGVDDPNGDFNFNAYNEVNTNFKLTQSNGANEAVVFADPSGVIIDSFELNNPNQANHSWGRMPEGNGPFRIMTTPTQNAANSTTVFVSYAVKPVFSIEAGYQTGPISLAITSPQPGVEIRYTTNGNVPTQASTLYTGPISLSTTTVVRAIAFHSDPAILPSFIETNTYFFGNDQHTVPVWAISGNTLGDGSWSGNELTCIEYFDANGQFLEEATGDSNEHGNDSNGYQQRGFDLIVRDALGYSNGIEEQVFRDYDRDHFDRLIFKAGANDNYPFSGGAHIRDSYLHALSVTCDLKMDERTYEPCIIYINGQYWGVYDVREKADDNDYTEYHHDQSTAYLYYLKTWGGTWQEYGAPNAQPTWNTLVQYILNNDMTVQANYDYVKSELNVVSLIDYFVLNTYAVCMDWLNWNTAWWKGRHPDGEHKKWGYVLWDLDASFGHYVNYTGIPNTSPTADPCDIQGLGNVGGQGHVPILNKLFTSPEFQATYINRYADLSNTCFSCDNMITFLDSLILNIDPEMPRQIQRWGGNYNTWQNKVQELRDFILSRCADEIVSGIEDCYDVVAQGLTVEIQGPGNVQISTVTLTNADVPWSGIYYSPLQINIEAIETIGVFSHWEVVTGDIVIADPLALVTSMVMNSDGTIRAVFITELTASVSQTTATLCHNTCDGTATITAVGGTGPYVYSWDGVIGEATISTLCPGPHTASVTDAVGAVLDFQFVIDAPAPVVLNPTVNQITCFGLTNGSLIANASGGTAPYFFTLDPLGTTNQTGSFNNLFEGGYTLDVLDDNGCPATFSFNIIEPAGMTINVVNTINLVCGGQCNGSVILNVQGGTPQYSFVWNNSAQTGTNDLCAGTNTVVVTDAQGCFVSQSVELTQPDPLQLVIVSSNATCIGMENGTAIVSALGGTPPLVYDLGPVLTLDNLDALAFGTYPVTVTDAFNCTSSGDIIIGYDVISDLDVSVFTSPVSCWNQQDGTATAIVTGGVEPVTVQWDDPKNQKTHTAVGLAEETYSVKVTDDLGCNISAQATVEITQGCFFIASVLTPNGDGANDLWTVGGLEHFPRSSVQVFDRWGQLLFESKGYPNPWDGTYNGKKLPLADYYYVITYDPKKEPITGTVSIKF